MTGTRGIFGRRAAFDRVGLPEANAAPVRSFGKRGAGAGNASTATQAPEAVPFPAAARARLARLCRDLTDLYPDAVVENEAPFFKLHDEPETTLAIGRNGAVHVDASRGVYQFRIEGRKSGTVTIETADDEALLDHIICHLDRERVLSARAHGLISALAGRSLEQVERGLILATLRRFHFSRNRAAEVLGISVRIIRDKLRRHRAGNGADGGESDVPRVRESLPDAHCGGDRSLSEAPFDQPIPPSR